MLTVVMVVSLFSSVPFMTADAVDTSQIKETLSGDTLSGYTVMFRPVGNTSYSLCIQNNGKSSEQHDLHLFNIGDSSRLYLDKAGTNTYYIHFFNGANTFDKSDRVLDVKSGEKGVVYTKNKSDVNTQKWKLILLNDGTYWVQNYDSGMYWTLDKPNSFTEGNSVVQRSEPIKWEISLVAGGNYQKDNVPASVKAEYDSYSFTNTEGETVTSVDWMSHLPDAVAFTDISIPGTHDSGALHFDGANNNTAQCQQLTIKDLLNAGVRYFDIRLNKTKVNGEQKLRLVHGAVHAKFGDDFLWLDTVIGWVKQFLKENPGETIVFQLKNDGGDGGGTQKLAYPYFKNLAKTDLVYKGGYFPTLDKLRGKLLLLSRFDKYSDSDFKVGSGSDQWMLDVKNWNKSEKFKVNGEDVYSSVITRDEKEFQVWSQDDYDHKMSTKYRYVRDSAFHETYGADAKITAASARGKRALVVSYSSGVSFGLAHYPQSVARTVNPQLVEKLYQWHNSGSTKGKRVGVICSDFSEEQLAWLVYRNNFDRSFISIDGYTNDGTEPAHKVTLSAPQGTALSSVLTDSMLTELASGFTFNNYIAVKSDNKLALFTKPYSYYRSKSGLLADKYSVDGKSLEQVEVNLYAALDKKIGKLDLDLGVKCGTVVNAQTPSGLSIVSGSGYTVTETNWTKDGAAFTGTMAAGDQMTLQAGLKVNFGYSLADNVQLILANGTVTSSSRNSGESFTLTATRTVSHDIVKVAAKEATDEEDGCIEHWRCNGCGKCFSSAAADHEIPAEITVISHVVPELRDGGIYTVGKKLGVPNDMYLQPLDQTKLLRFHDYQGNYTSVDVTYDPGSNYIKLNDTPMAEVAETQQYIFTGKYIAKYENVNATNLGYYFYPLYAKKGTEQWDWNGTESAQITFDTIYYYKDSAYYGLSTSQKADAVITSNITVEPGCVSVGSGSFTATLTTPEGYVFSNTIIAEVPATGDHTLTHTDGVTPVYNTSNGQYTNGNIEYWHCSECGKYFSDEACKHEVTAAETVAPYFEFGYYSNGTEPGVKKYNGADTTVTVPDKVPNNYPDASLRGLNVTYVHTSGFKANTTVAKVVLGDNITHIGNEAFKGCSGLKEIEIGTALKTIDADTFYDCYALEKFTCKSDEYSVSVTSYIFNKLPKLVIYGMHTGNFHYSAMYAPRRLDLYGTKYPYYGIDAHRYLNSSDLVWNWADDFRSATATLICRDCNDRHDENATITETVAYESGEGSGGTKTITASVTAGDKTFSDSKTVTIPAAADAMTASYVNLNDETVTVTDAFRVTGSESGLTTAWYAVTEDTEFTERLTVSGKANLIICDGKTISLPKGVEIASGGSLTIWGQNAQTGALTASAEENVSAVKGSVNLNGGAITASGYNGTVKLGRIYTDGTACYQIGKVADNSAISGKTLVLHVHGSYTKVPSVAPTYDAATGACTDGNIEYYTCTCGKYYTYDSQNGNYTEISEAETVLPYFEFVPYDTGARLNRYHGADAEVTVPDTVTLCFATQEVAGGAAVLSVGTDAFRGNKTVTKVVMGDNLTKITWQAFKDYTRLKEVEVGSALSVIDNETFMNCAGGFKLTTTSVNSMEYAAAPFKNTNSYVVCGYHDAPIKSNVGISHFIGIDAHDDPTWIWTDDYSGAKVKFNCSRCSYSTTERTANVTSEILSAPTYSTEGEVKYTAIYTVGDIDYTDEKTAVLPVLSRTTEVSYIDLNGGTQTVTANVAWDEYTELTAGWYAVTADTEFTNRLAVSGNVNLILCDEAAFTVPKGIEESGGSLTVWGQENGTGSLTVDDPDENTAGISGGVTINGGTVNVATISGGVNYNGGAVTVTGEGIDGDVTLSYTHTYDSFYSFNYNGTVTLEKEFANGYKLLEVGEVSEVFDVVGETLVPHSHHTYGEPE